MIVSQFIDVKQFNFFSKNLEILQFRNDDFWEDYHKKRISIQSLGNKICANHEKHNCMIDTSNAREPEIHCVIDRFLKSIRYYFTSFYKVYELNNNKTIFV